MSSAIAGISSSGILAAVNVWGAPTSFIKRMKQSAVEMATSRSVLPTLDRVKIFSPKSAKRASIGECGPDSARHARRARFGRVSESKKKNQSIGLVFFLGRVDKKMPLLILIHFGRIK